MVTARSRPQGRSGHRIRLTGRLRKFSVVSGASAAINIAANTLRLRERYGTGSAERPWASISRLFDRSPGRSALLVPYRLRLKMSKYAFLRSNATLIIVGLLLGLVS